MSDIRCFKMFNGDDVICDVLKELNNELEIQNPAAIVIQRSQDGRMAVGLAPYAPFAEDGLMTLYRSAIAGVVKIDVNLRNEWSRLFGSGIQIASAQNLMLPS